MRQSRKHGWSIAVAQMLQHQLHTSRLQQEKEKPHVTKKFLIRKSRPQEDGKKSHFLVAYPALSDESKKTLNYSGVEGPLVDNNGYILPHSILGTLQEFKTEALKREHYEAARLVPDDSQLKSTIQVLEKYKEKKKKTGMPPSQHMALQNWHHNMALRKKEQRRLCERLQRSESLLLMNDSDNYRKIQEQRTLIDLSLSALYAGKGHQGTEFWREPVHIGNEITGLTLTLSQTERGFPEEVTHIGKPCSIWNEMGTRPPKYQPFHRAWEKSLFLKQRRNELKEILEELDFYNPDLDGLEVVGRSQPFTHVSAERFTPCDGEDKEFAEEEKVQDLLEEYPDVFSEPILGPSLKFCGQPARWIDDICHEGEIGIAARVTFEILVGEKAESVLTVSNDGTAAVWYDWRRLPQPFTFQERKKTRMQNFYFNTRSGVILPGEARNFSFIFKSMNAGIFSESWEFGTHPVLLGGAVLQVTLWGVALYEDISSDLREELQNELDAREAAVIVEENLKELLDRIRTPELTRSPLDAYATEEDLFHRQNPELRYQHQVVKELHELWDKLMNPPSAAYASTIEGSSPAKSIVDLQQKSPEDVLHPRSVSPAVSGVGKSATEELIYQTSGTAVEDISQMEVQSRVEWNLSIADFKQTVLTLPEEEEREAALTQLNKAALELCNAPVKPQADLLYHICFQLWREVIDGLVARSLMLRSLLGMPEKDTYVEIVPEEPVEAKPAAAGKGGKEDRKVQRDEKKAAAKEKEKAKAAKEERPNSRKGKVRDEKKTKSSVKESKEAVSYTGDGVEAGLQREQVDPVVQEKYHEKLYIEVYGLLNSMVSKMTFLFEELKDSLEKKKKVNYV